jgi:hypothetical protein
MTNDVVFRSPSQREASVVANPAQPRSTPPSIHPELVDDGDSTSPASTEALQIPPGPTGGVGETVAHVAGAGNRGDAHVEPQHDASADDSPYGTDKPAPARIPFHPCAEIFPMHDDAHLQLLADDIKKNGLLEAIVLHEDKILDGRGRDRACELAGVKPRYETFKGGNALEYVVSKNVMRRHLTDNQRAMAAAKAANLSVGANQTSEGLSIGRAAKLFNVSDRSAGRAREVITHGIPELVSAVESGKLRVSKAADISREGESSSAYSCRCSTVGDQP